MLGTREGLYILEDVIVSELKFIHSFITSNPNFIIHPRMEHSNITIGIKSLKKMLRNLTHVNLFSTNSPYPYNKIYQQFILPINKAIENGSSEALYETFPQYFKKNLVSMVLCIQLLLKLKVKLRK